MHAETTASVVAGDARAVMAGLIGPPATTVTAAAAPQRRRPPPHMPAAAATPPPTATPQTLAARCSSINSNTTAMTTTTTTDDGVTIIRAAAPHDATLVDAVVELAGLRLDGDDGAAAAARAKELIRLGAVYVGRELKGRASVKWARATALYADPLAARVAAGDMLRVHPQPLRFAAACGDDDGVGWARRVLHVCDDLVVVNKPAGLPCMPHESNAAEHVAPCVAVALGLGQLQALHRLDAWTSGVVVLGRTAAAARAFNDALQQRARDGGGGISGGEGITDAADGAVPSVRKWYRALTAVNVPLGTHEHWMYGGPCGPSVPAMSGRALRQRGPRLLCAAPVAGWKRCELAVEACAPAGAAARAWAARTLGGDCGGDAATADTVFYEVRVRLVTGRTHQIRAQLAALGAPCMGDAMYGAMPGVTAAAAPNAGDDDDDDGSSGGGGVLADAAGLAAVEAAAGAPHGPLALHAERLVWGAREFAAPPPWE